MGMGVHARPVELRELSLLASEIVKFISGPVAQLDRANGYEPLGREFESLRAHHSLLVELKLVACDLRVTRP